MSIHVCRILSKLVIPRKRKGIRKYVCVFMRDGEKRKDEERENIIFNPKKEPYGMMNGQRETGGQSERNKQNIEQK